MKKIKQYVIFSLMIVSLAICNCSIPETHSNNSKILDKTNEDCLSIANFNLVKKFILENGSNSKLYKIGVVADTNIMSQQIIIDNKILILVDSGQNDHIIVLDTSNPDEIPAYFVAVEKNKCEISAYYSVLDTDISIKTRKNDWCNIIEKIEKYHKN